MKVELDTRILDRIVAGGLEGALEDVVGGYAYKVEAGAKRNIREAPKFGGEAGEVGAIDTGALLNSIHTTTSWGKSGYGQAAAEAAARRPEAQVAPEAKPGEPPGGGRAANIDAPMEYALYVEKGTVRMPARPYLVPALEAIRDEFVEAARKAIEGLSR